MTTALFAGIYAFMLLGLSVYTVKGRRQLRVALGDGEQLEMKRRMRAHANFVEYTPFFLILLGYNEMMGLSALWVHGFGWVFLAGRLMHAYSLLKGEQYDNQKIIAYPMWRMRAMVTTFTCLGLLAGRLLYLSLI